MIIHDPDGWPNLMMVNSHYMYSIFLQYTYGINILIKD